MELSSLKLRRLPERSARRQVKVSSSPQHDGSLGARAQDRPTRVPYSSRLCDEWDAATVAYLKSGGILTVGVRISSQLLALSQPSPRTAPSLQTLRVRRLLAIAFFAQIVFA